MCFSSPLRLLVHFLATSLAVAVLLWAVLAESLRAAAEGGSLATPFLLVALIGTITWLVVGILDRPLLALAAVACGVALVPVVAPVLLSLV